MHYLTSSSQRKYIYYTVTQGQNLYSTLLSICKVVREKWSLDLNPGRTNSCDHPVLSCQLYCSGSQGAPKPSVVLLKTCFKCLVSQVLHPGRREQGSVFRGSFTFLQREEGTLCPGLPLPESARWFHVHPGEGLWRTKKNLRGTCSQLGADRREFQEVSQSLYVMDGTL